MRTIVDIPEGQIAQLDQIGAREKLSRAELVRRAVAEYLREHKKDQKALLDKYFGMMKGSSAFDNMDGLAWQKKMRGEWDKREADMDRRLAESRSQGLHDQKQDPFDHQ